MSKNSRRLRFQPAAERFRSWRRFVTIVGGTLLVAACGETTTAPMISDITEASGPSFMHIRGGSHLELKDQATCEGLDPSRGLTPTYFPDPRSGPGTCTLSGTGLLTAFGEEMTISMEVIHSGGTVTNNGDLILTPLTGRWLATGNFVNFGTVTALPSLFLNAAFDHLSGTTDNFGYWTLGTLRSHVVVNGTFNNRGSYSHGGVIAISTISAFVNQCGSTFIDAGGEILINSSYTQTPIYVGCALEQQVVLLDEAVGYLAGVLREGQANALHAKLAQVLKELDDGRTQTAINALNAFIRQVKGFIAAGEITSGQGQTLINRANQLLAELNL